MLKVLVIIASAFCSFVLSGINPAIVISNAIYHKDIRTIGSGNPGFTNFKRAFGGKYAWFVFALDLLKSALLCLLFGLAFRAVGMTFQLGAAMTGFFAMLGHAYPIWYKFKGGKGFLVGAAAIWFIDWRAGLVAFVFMMILLFTLKYMSLSVIVAAISTPITLAIVHVQTPWVLVFCILSVLFMIWRHRSNIQRLIKGQEPKFSLVSKSE